MNNYTKSWNVIRKYTTFKGKEYILDVVDADEIIVIAEDIVTGKKEKGYHANNETIAIQETLNKFY